MSKRRRVLCYLRTHRRAWGLTQRELAFIIGFRSATHISRIEQGKRVPTVEAALACQVIFGLPPSEMFPDIYASVEERVMRNIYELHLGLSNTTSPPEIRKRELCSLALKRAITRPNLEQGS